MEKPDADTYCPASGKKLKMKDLVPVRGRYSEGRYGSTVRVRAALQFGTIRGGTAVLRGSGLTTCGVPKGVLFIYYLCQGGSSLTVGSCTWGLGFGVMQIAVWDVREPHQVHDVLTAAGYGHSMLLSRPSARQGF